MKVGTKILPLHLPLSRITKRGKIHHPMFAIITICKDQNKKQITITIYQEQFYTQIELVFFSRGCIYPTFYHHNKKGSQRFKCVIHQSIIQKRQSPEILYFRFFLIKLLQIPSLMILIWISPQKFEKQFKSLRVNSTCIHNTIKRICPVKKSGNWKSFETVPWKLNLKLTHLVNFLGCNCICTCMKVN